MEKYDITVTSPLLPPLEEFFPYLQKIWENKWLTNNGDFHQQLERELAAYLGVDYISLFSNGTLPLITALQALGIKGEVITTPYSFVATSHSIWWNGLTPVFVDVDPITGNMDPKKIEEAITPNTTAIMPVHVYGVPCDTERIQSIADKYGLNVIYDAAHAFGVKKDGVSILRAGDVSTLSFHATKTYNTAEGGALICHSKQMKRTVDYLKNFGFEDETTVVAPGINSKMDEIRAALGLLNLKYIDSAICRRKEIARLYIDMLAGVPGISIHLPILQSIYSDNIELNYGYFPIFVDEKVFPLSRDGLYNKLKDNGIYARRYFYPLITSFAPYNRFPHTSDSELPVSYRMSNQVLCLPIHDRLTDSDIERIAGVIKSCSKLSAKSK